MNIKIEGSIAEVTYKEGMRTFSKNVDFDELIDSLAQKSGLSTPVLPFGTKLYSKQNGTHKLFIEMLPMKRRIKYVNGGQTIFNDMVPMPFGVFIVELREVNGRFQIQQGNSRIFALKGPILTKNDKLYRWPTPNVYTQGNICWGSGSNTLNQMSSLDSPHQAGRIIDMFFSGNFNNHIHPQLNGYSSNEYVRFLNDMKERQQFDDDILTTHGTHVRNYL